LYAAVPREFMQADMNKWADVVRKSGAKAD
jgi:hypothetical protein